MFHRDPKESQCLVLQAALGCQAHLVSQAMGDQALSVLLGHQGLQEPLGHPQDMAQVDLISRTICLTITAISYCTIFVSDEIK